MKVSELYEMVKKWDAVVDTLPHVVDRLTALNDLHEQGQCHCQISYYYPSGWGIVIACNICPSVCPCMQLVCV